MLTPEQLEFRRNGIGGSDVAAIFGISRWKTPVDIYLEKIGEAPIRKETEWQYMGKKIESIIAEVFQEKTGKEVCNPIGTSIHPEKTFMIANIDRQIVGESAILECKNTMLSHGWGDEGSDEIPDEYLLQVAHYTIVKNVDRAYIAVLIAGNSFRTYTYERNERLESTIISKEENFWNEHVLKRIPPPIQNIEDAKNLYKNSVFSSVMANTTLKEIIKDIKETKSKIKDLENYEDNLKILIFKEMQFSEALADEFGNVIATWKQQKMTKFDTDSFKKDHPNLYKKYCKTNTFRKFMLR
jgi:putative phage-type endonuclease